MHGAGAQHNSFSGEFHTITLAPEKKLYKSLGKWQYRWSFPGDNSSSQVEGQETVVDINSFMSRNFFIAATSTSRYQPYQLPENIFDLNPYQTNTGGTVLASQVAPASDFVHVHDIEATYVFTNASNLSTQCQLYFFQAKRDMPQYNISGTQYETTPVVAWWAAVNSKTLNQTVQTLQSDTRVSTATAGYENITILKNNFNAMQANFQYGESPLSERQFRAMYAKLACYNFVLDGGDNHRITMRFKINKTVSKAQAAQIAAGNLKGTIFATLISRPSLVYVQTTTPSNGVDEPTVGVTKVGWNVFCKMNLSSLGGSRLEYDRVFTGNIAGSAHNPEKIILDTDQQGQMVVN